MDRERMTKAMAPALKNVCAGAVLFVVCLLFFLLGFSIQEKSMTGAVSARSVPQVVSAAGMLVSLYMMIKNWMDYRAAKKESAQEPQLTPAKRWGLMGLSLLLLVAYVAAMNTLGFIITSVLYLFLQMLLITEKRTWKSILLLAVISVAVPVLFYIPFRYGFKLMLPVGELFK